MKETKADAVRFDEKRRTPSAPEFVRISKAAKEIYGCTTQNLYKQIRRGNLKVYERFGHRVLKVEEVKELAEFIEPRGGDRKFIPKKS